MHALAIPIGKVKAVDLTKLLPRPTHCAIDPVLGVPVGDCGPGVIGYTPPFCGGNSGIPCPTTGFLGVQSQPPPADLRPGLYGLEDIAPMGYVTAGTRVRWSASLSCGDVFPSSSQIQQCVLANLGDAFTDASVQVTSSWFPGASPSISIEATSTIDRGNINDIASNFTTSLLQCGCGVTSSNAPVVVGRGVLTGDSQQQQPTGSGPCDSKTGADWVACQLGVSPTAALAGGIGASTLLLIGGFILVLALIKR